MSFYSFFNQQYLHMRTLVLHLIFSLMLLSAGRLLAESYPLEIDADRSDCGTDLENCTLSGNVLIRQGDATINADRLFSRSETEWELSGNIMIEKTGMSINAQQAKISLAQRQLQSFTLMGSPVQFQYLVGDDSRAQGRADNISFDLNTRMITLDGNARLVEAGNELKGEHIEYDIDAERFKANNQGQGDGRVHLIFAPPGNDVADVPEIDVAEESFNTPKLDDNTTDKSETNE